MVKFALRELSLDRCAGRVATATRHGISSGA